MGDELWSDAGMGRSNLGEAKCSIRGQRGRIQSQRMGAIQQRESKNVIGILTVSMDVVS